MMQWIQTDEQLIEQFLTAERDEAEAAFEALVNRHRPMMLRVCRQVLDRHHDAEDAVQATFLTLALKAGTILNRKALGVWLREVAYRKAIRVKVQTARRRGQPGTWDTEVSVAGPQSDADGNELRAVLYAEVNDLPAKYGIPLLLCYLEGETNEEVARLLGWPIGTVKGRLSRAQGLLRARLTRRGLDLDPMGHPQQ